ncbi:hypothetical protein [Nocardioides sp. NPDC047086]|uniref:hypothetical protein n=1 Tax=Nocardioides sp. NPDC047086 TaxID=3154810 RepID=UPI0033C722AB
MRGIRIPALATAILAALMLPVTLLSPASAAPSVSVRPLPLPQGGSPTVPYVAGHSGDFDVVDGATVVPVPTEEFDTVALLGRAGTGYLVRIVSGDRVPDRVVRVEPGKAPKQLAEAEYFETSKLSTNGRYLLLTAYPSTVVVRVLDAGTGHQVARHSFRLATEPLPLDVRGTKVVIGGWAPARTMTWDWSTGAVSTIANRSAYAASYATNRLASYTMRPNDAGACSVVSTLTSPGSTTWRTCTEKVASFSPDGARVATEPIDHQDVAYFVKRRSVNGTLLTTYTNPNGVWAAAWETKTRILLRSYANDGASWLVRCEAAACERAARGNVG